MGSSRLHHSHLFVELPKPTCENRCTQVAQTEHRGCLSRTRRHWENRPSGEVSAVPVSLGRPLQYPALLGLTVSYGMGCKCKPCEVSFESTLKSRSHFAVITLFVDVCFVRCRPPFPSLCGKHSGGLKNRRGLFGLRIRASELGPIRSRGRTVSHLRYAKWV